MTLPIDQSVWFGVAGGLLGSVASIIQWAKSAKEERPPSPLRDGGFWMLFFLLPVLGGVVVFLYERSSVTFNPILAVHVGASAPVLLQQFITTAPPIGKAG